MPRYTPTLVVLYGSYAHEIGTKIKDLVCREIGAQSLPEIFQFVNLPDADSGGAVVSSAYATALSHRATAAAERALDAKVDASRLESYVIAPLQTDALGAALEVSRAIDECALDTISGGRNAVFLIARRLLSLDSESLQSAAMELDSSMQGVNFPFGRCFFVDEVNEVGQTVDRKDDLANLVANFISLALASELSDVLKSNPTPYAGTPPHSAAYASFTCDRIYFESDTFIEKLSHCLARDVTRSLLTPSQADNRIDELLAKGAALLNDGSDIADSTEDAEWRRKIETSESSTVDEAASKRAVEKLDEFMRSVLSVLDHNLILFRAFLERYLERWLVHLETLAARATAMKEDMAESSIRAMLKISAQERYLVEEEEPRTWWQVLTFRPPRLIRRERLRPVAAARAAERELLRHRRLHSQIERAAMLFTRLDAACVNLDLMQRMSDVSEVDVQTPSLFTFDLIDDELVNHFYLSLEYSNREADIRGFASSLEFKCFLAKLFSYPDGNPRSHLTEYCVRCFDFLRDYKIERICEIKRHANQHRDLICLSTPFWRPITSSTGEKLTIFCCASEQSETNLKRLIDARNRSAAEIFVPLASADRMSVIQISYGMGLQEIFLHAEPSSSKAVTVGIAGNS